MTDTYRIEILDDTGRWVAAPGEAGGYTATEVEQAIDHLRTTLAHDYPDQPDTEIRACKEDTMMTDYSHDLPDPDYTDLDRRYLARALQGLRITRACGYTLVDDGVDVWLTDQELGVSPTTTDREAADREDEIASGHADCDAYTDLCTYTGYAASREGGGRIDEAVVLSAIRARLFDADHARTWWGAGDLIECGCQACGETAYQFAGEFVDEAGGDLEWITDEGVPMCPDCQSYSVDEGGDCICETHDCPDITWDTPQTGRAPGCAMWQEGVDADGQVWRREERGGGHWTAPARVSAEGAE